MTKLINLVLNLSSEEQRFLLKKIEKLSLKEKRAKEIGIYSKVCRLSKETSQDELIKLIDDINNE